MKKRPSLWRKLAVELHTTTRASKFSDASWFRAKREKKSVGLQGALGGGQPLPLSDSQV
jgi:hypothetical protein